MAGLKQILLPVLAALCALLLATGTVATSTCPEKKSKHCCMQLPKVFPTCPLLAAANVSSTHVDATGLSNYISALLPNGERTSKLSAKCQALFADFSCAIAGNGDKGSPCSQFTHTAVLHGWHRINCSSSLVNDCEITTLSAPDPSDSKRIVSLNMNDLCHTLPCKDGSFSCLEYHFALMVAIFVIVCSFLIGAVVYLYLKKKKAAEVHFQHTGTELYARNRPVPQDDADGRMLLGMDDDGL